MTVKLDSFNELYMALANYKGTNPYIHALKAKTEPLTTFELDYVRLNITREPIEYNKIIRLSRWFAESKQKEWGIDVLPNKFLMIRLVGETNGMYHIYGKYRQSMEPGYFWLPKKVVLTKFKVTDYKSIDLDLSMFDNEQRQLKEHQKEGVKFLYDRKKCILADDMGLGKTTTATVASIASGYQHILVVCPASVKTTWMKELSYYVSEDDIVIVNGSKWNDKRYTIINYDILDNFYEVPTEKYVSKEKVFDENGNMSYKKVERERVSKKSDVVARAMENSQLYQSKFDLIIIDEIHRLSNKTSGRYKIISDLVKRSHPKGIYAITGTPITNNPMNLYNVLKLIDCEIVDDWEYYVRSYCDGKQMFNKKERDGWTKKFLRSKGKQEWAQLSYSEKGELKQYLEANCKKFWITSGASNLDDLAEAIKHVYIRREKGDFNQIVDKKVETMVYELPTDLKEEYENVWNEYISAKSEGESSDAVEYKSIIEGNVLRQWAAMKMVPYTDAIVQRHLANGEKVMVVCCFDNELYKFQEMYGDKCVVYNGKMSQKQKDAAQKAFMEDESVRIFVGNIIACGVGLTLTSGNVCVFNNFSWVPSDNQQVMDRVHRLNQTKDVMVYYQIFKDTVFSEMYEKVMGKENIIQQVIKN